MSSRVVVDARGLSKRFHIYERPHHRLLELLGGRTRAQEFWAVRDADLRVQEGETVGIVGRNGSGKSTLLQMVCGTLEPTSGQLEVRGRVAALLELGAGFNPDFTGLENVYLNASLLGLSRKETEQHLAGIIDFAGIGDFLYQPVRTYSSGMYIRLAFAVAIAVDPDLLVIDEALAVGDEAFQRKCFARIEELKANGTAVLFVSHSAGAVLQLCDRVVLMDDGEALLQGQPKAVIAHYHRLLYASERRRAQIRLEIASLSAATDDVAATSAAPLAEVPAVEPHDAEAVERFDPAQQPQSTLSYPSRGARIVDPHVIGAGGERVNVLIPGGLYRYRYQVVFEETCRGVHFGMMVKTLSGVELFGMASHAFGDAIQEVAAGSSVDVEFQFRSAFLPGAYFLNAGCMGLDPRDGETFLHRVMDAVMLRVEMPRTDRRYAGLVDLSEGEGCRLRFNAVETGAAR